MSVGVYGFSNIAHNDQNIVSKHENQLSHFTHKLCTMETYTDSSDDDHEQHHEPQPILHTPTQVTTEVSRIFQQNIKEEKNQMTVLQIRRTVREKIFPFMKFTNKYVLRQMKLRESDNMVHLLLQDLN